MESNAAGVSSKMRAKLTIIFSSRRLLFGDLHKGSCCGVFGCKSLTESVQEKMDRGTDEPPHEEAVSQI